MRYVFDFTSKAKVAPFIVRTDVDKDSDREPTEVNTKRAPPRLFIYFTIDRVYEGARLTADGFEVNIPKEQGATAAVVAFLAAHYVYHVGYNDQWKIFLCVMEHVVLGVDFNPQGEYKNVKTRKFLKNFNEAVTK